MELPSNHDEVVMVVFDLIVSDQAWNGQSMFDFIEQRLAENNVNKSSIPFTISVSNLSKQRSLFNNTTYRKRMKNSCSRYRTRIGCDDDKTLFDFFYPVPAQPAVEPVPASDYRKNDKKKINKLQKKLRRSNAKCDLIKKQNIKLTKRLATEQERSETERRVMAKQLKIVKCNSRRKSASTTEKRQTIATMRKALKKCAQLATKKQNQEMKKMMKALGDNAVADWIDDFDSSAENSDDEEERDDKLLRLLIIQKQSKVSRDAVRQFCKAFDDEDVKADRLESKWKQCRSDVVDLYKLEVISNVATDKKGFERVYVYVVEHVGGLAVQIGICMPTGA
jgi:hypothetical protein